MNYLLAAGYTLADIEECKAQLYADELKRRLLTDPAFQNASGSPCGASSNGVRDDLSQVA